jgi:hypothetical protein
MPTFSFLFFPRCSARWTPLVLAALVAVVAGSAITPTRAHASDPLAWSQEAAATNDPICPFVPTLPLTKPCDESARFSLTDVEVQGCEDAAIGKDSPTGIDFIAWRRFHDSPGSRTVQINEGLRRFEVWSGEQFLYACAKVTRDIVRQQIVERVSGRSHPSIRSVGKIVVVHGDDSTKFPGVRDPGKVVPTHSTLKLPRVLTQADLRAHRWGIKDTIVTIPLLQKPYVNADNPNSSVTGPMKTESKQHISWLG